MFLKVENSIDKEMFVKMSDRLNYIRKQIRIISHELINPYMNNPSENLIDFIKNLLVDYTYITPNVNFELNSFPNVIHKEKYNTSEILIIIKEIINNAVVHSKANNIDVNITDFENDLTLIVEDNGIGFNKKTKKNGNGLTNLTHRVMELKGEISIETAIGRGSTLIIKLPKNENFNS